MKSLPVSVRLSPNETICVYGPAAAGAAEPTAPSNVSIAGTSPRRRVLMVRFPEGGTGKLLRRWLVYRWPQPAALPTGEGMVCDDTDVRPGKNPPTAPARLRSI